MFGVVQRNNDPVRLTFAPQIAWLEFDIDHVGIFRGTVRGIQGNLEYRKPYAVYVAANVDWIMGAVKAQQDMSRYIHDLKSTIRLGFTVPLYYSRGVFLTLYSGFGFDYNIQHIRPDNVLGSEKYYYYQYFIPAGFSFEARPFSYFGFGLNLEWDPQINSRVKLDGQPGIKWDLYNKSGYIIEVPFNFFIASSKLTTFSISIIPYLRRNVEGKLSALLSNGSKYELPKQTFKYWGGRLGFTFIF